MTPCTAPHPTAAAQPRLPAAPIATAEPPWVRRLLIGVALAFLALFLFVPLAAVFAEALREGLGAYFAGVRRSRRAGGDPADAARRRPSPCR